MTWAWLIPSPRDGAIKDFRSLSKVPLVESVRLRPTRMGKPAHFSMSVRCSVNGWVARRRRIRQLAYFRTKAIHNFKAWPARRAPFISIHFRWSIYNFPLSVNRSPCTQCFAVCHNVRYPCAFISRSSSWHINNRSTRAQPRWIFLPPSLTGVIRRNLATLESLEISHSIGPPCLVWLRVFVRLLGGSSPTSGFSLFHLLCDFLLTVIG